MDPSGSCWWIRLLDPCGSLLWLLGHLFSGSWWLWKDYNGSFGWWILLVDPDVDPDVDPGGRTSCGTILDLAFWWKPVVIPWWYSRQILLDLNSGSWWTLWWIQVVDPGGSCYSSGNGSLWIMWITEVKYQVDRVVGSRSWILVDPVYGSKGWIQVDPSGGSYCWILLDPSGRSWWIQVVDPGGSQHWIIVDHNGGSW